MRAVAAVAVVATHASFWGGAYAEPGSAPRWRVSTSASRSSSCSPASCCHGPGSNATPGRLPPPSTGRYLWKRALRIIPVYVLAAVAALVLLPGNSGASPALWVKTLLLSNIYLDDHLPDGLTQMWSLATEVAFYLLLPGIMWLALSRRRRGTTLPEQAGGRGGRARRAQCGLAPGPGGATRLGRFDDRAVAPVVPDLVLGRDRDGRVLRPRPSGSAGRRGRLGQGRLDAPADGDGPRGLLDDRPCPVRHRRRLRSPDPPR